MYKLIADIFARALLAGLAAGIAVLAFDSVATVGESPAQSAIVLAFYLYCILALLLPSGQKLMHVLSIPVITQFLHLLQKYDFPAGANSLWRLLPFLIIDLYLIDFILRQKTRTSRSERMLLISWLGTSLAYLLISPNLAGIVTGASVLFLVTIPLCFIYLKSVSQIPGSHLELEKYFFLIFIILGAGTFGLVFIGARYMGSDNLLVTRNISDTNVTMAYFILLWPFVLLYLRRSPQPVFWISLLTAMFSAIVLLSFSRGALLIVGPYMTVSLLFALGAKRQIAITAMAAVLLPYAAPLATAVNEDLAYSWQLRFADFQSLSQSVTQLQEASGRTAIHAAAFALFLESPFFGHGIGSFEVLSTGYREAHSMYYTLLAEQGLAGAIYMYSLFLLLGVELAKSVVADGKFALLFLAVITYLLFVHSVGYVFVIIPSKSLTINCIAPILLLAIYFYSQAVRHDYPS